MSGDVTLGALKRLDSVLAGQDIDSVDINGGSIDGATLGASTPVVISNMTRTDRQIYIPLVGNAAVGATAGWTIAGTDFNHAKLPAGSTDSTLIVAIPGLEIGDTVTRVSMMGRIESAGNIAVLTMSIRKLTVNAAGNADAQIATVTTGDITANTKLQASNFTTPVFSYPIIANEVISARLTGTTAASTDFDMAGLLVTVTRS